MAGKLTAEVAELRKLLAPTALHNSTHKAVGVSHASATRERPVSKVLQSAATSPRNAEADRSEGLTGPEQRILDALAWLSSIGVERPEQAAVAFLAGYTIGGGAFNNPKGKLRGKGLIEYVPGDCLLLTDSGRQVANLPTAPLTTEALHTAVLIRLPGPEQKILRVLLDAYPAPVSYEELARLAGYAEGGGAFNNPRGRLRSLGLIEYPGRGVAVAKPLLFLER